MWNTIINLFVGITAQCFAWFDMFMDKFDGAWGTIFSLFVITVICRFLFSSIIGFTISAGSDTVERPAPPYRKDYHLPEKSQYYLHD